MANDFSLDPYQVEEDNLSEQYKRALLKTLRPTPDMSDFSARARHSFERTSGEQEMGDIQGRRTALGNKFQESLTNALRGQDPEVRDLAMNPATRTQGLALMQKRQQMKMDQEEMNAMGGGGGSTLPQSSFQEQYQRALRMAQSSNPTIAARGKVLLEQMKPQNPIQSIRTLPSGETVPVEGADPAFKRQAFAREMMANPEGMKVPDGKGGWILVPWSQVLGESETPGNVVPSPRALPSATGAAPPPPSPVSAPISAVSGPPAGTGERPPPVFNLSGKLSPEEAMAIGNDRVNPAPDPNPVQSIGGYSPTLPPQGPVGTTPSSLETELIKQGRKADTEAYQKLQEARTSTYKMQETLDSLEEMNKSPMYGGPLSGTVSTIAGLGATFGGSSGAMAQNTNSFDAEVQRVIAPTLKQYGYNPSNVDLIAAQKSMPSTTQDATTRQKIIDQIRRGIAFEQGIAPIVDRLVHEDYSVTAAQELAGKAYRYSLEKKANPTGAGSATKRALPASVARQDAALKEEGGDFGRALKDSLEAMKYATPLSEGGRQGMYDAYGDMLEGGKQLVGQGNREGVAAERARQEKQAQTLPGYAQAKAFHSTANPTALIPGKTILTGALAAGAQGLLQPQESAGEQLVAGAKSAAFGAGGGLASTLIPSTAAAKGINLTDDLTKFNIKPTSAQLNPDTFQSKLAAMLGLNAAAAPAQIKSITMDLMKKAGMEGDEVSKKTIDAARSTMGEAYDKMFPQGLRVKVQPDDIKKLQDAITKTPTVEDLMAKAPELARIHNILTTGGAVGAIGARNLHKAWKEVGSVATDAEAAGAVREVLTSIIERALPAGEKNAFKALNTKWGNLQDVERVWRGGEGLGVGTTSKYLAPSKLEAAAGKGPQPGSPTDEAVALIKKLDIKDAHQKLPDFDISRPGTWANPASKFTGPVLNAVDASAVRAPNSVKRMLELLRATTARGIPSAFAGSE